ncbi:MAG: eukaryotic-like serine/threonine-protein kinase [Abditibacteriota bacterium]|nr:eukaryotic-like serine/threonine-protein kinase [Abditibacteriota bacterium]
MAEVFKVWHTGLHRFEAMKSLLPNLGSDALFVQRFLHEARIAAALSHPHIAAIYNVGPDDAPRPFFTMEFIEGGDLADLFESNGKMSLEQAISLLRPTADALDYAHARGVVHRDVKPGNILLHTTSRSGWSAKVVDFGIARAQEDQGGTRLTKAGLIVGTPEYMSPEQAGNGQPVDHRTDLYSLGVIAYEMVCGRPPFWAQGNLSSLSVIASHLRDNPPPPCHLEPSLPDSVNNAILKALAKNPDDRFSTCGEFIDALTRDVPIAVLPTSTAPVPALASTTKNGHPNATLTVPNGSSGNSLAFEKAADRDTEWIVSRSTKAAASGLAASDAMAPGSAASAAPGGSSKSVPAPGTPGDKNFKKWLWPGIAASIATLLVVAQFSRGTTSPSTEALLPTPSATASASALAESTASLAGTTPAVSSATPVASGASIMRKAPLASKTPSARTTPITDKTLEAHRIAPGVGATRSANGRPVTGKTPAVKSVKRTPRAAPKMAVRPAVRPRAAAAPRRAVTAGVPNALDRVRIEVSTQPIKFPVVRRPTTRLLVGQQRLLQAGKNGERQVRSRVATRAGRELARRVLQVKVLKHSVPQIALIGTRKATASAPSSRASRATRRASQRSSSADNSRRFYRSNTRRNSTRRNRGRTPRRNRRESSLPIVESSLP